MTILEAAGELRRRRVSARELAAQCLERIERLNPRLNAFITVTAEAALAQAEARDAELAAGRDRGPLHGIPIALKDVFETAGVRTTGGSALFADYVPSRQAAVAERLEAAGAVLLGKTNMHELAYGITSNNPHFGAVRNPWRLEAIPGGSSGGSGAAVAAGMCLVGMGTDTGGSIRIPASFCGTVGLKPTYGRVSRYGVLPLDFSLDHMGPLTRSAADAALVLNALAGHDPRDPTSSATPVDSYLPEPGALDSLAGVRLGLPRNFYFDRVQPEVRAAVRSVAARAEDLGAAVVEVTVPDIAALNAIGRVILLVEAAAVLAPYLGRRERFGADVLALLDQGGLLPGTAYVNAQRLRRVMQAEFGRLFGGIDCLLTPTTPATAPPLGAATAVFDGVEEDVRLAATRLVRGVNVLGLPALSAPCGLDPAGLPIGFQLVARPFAEAFLLRVGAALERALGREYGPPIL